jgi:hypothetical protein
MAWFQLKIVHQLTLQLQLHEPSIHEAPARPRLGLEVFQQVALSENLAACALPRHFQRAPWLQETCTVTTSEKLQQQ